MSLSVLQAALRRAKEDKSTHGVVPAVLSMLPLSSDAALDALIDAILSAALSAPLLLAEFAKTCSDLAEIDRSECFVSVTYKGWYFDASGLGDKWDGPHAGAVAAKAAAQRHVSFIRRLVASCKSACDAALRALRPPAGDADRAGSPAPPPLFAFVAHLSREGVLPRCVPLAYAAQLLGVGDAASAAHADFEGRVDAACAVMALICPPVAIPRSSGGGAHTPPTPDADARLLAEVFDAAERLLTLPSLDAAPAAKLRGLLAARRTGWAGLEAPPPPPPRSAGSALLERTDSGADAASAPAPPPAIPRRVCCACELELSSGQLPAGTCDTCRGDPPSESSAAEGLLCASCFRTHRKGAFAGHAASEWVDPAAGILARLQLQPAPAACAAHARPLELHCPVCPAATPALCSLCVRLHAAHADRLVLLSEFAQAQRGRLRALACEEGGGGEGGGGGTLVFKARQRAVALAAARDALPEQADAALQAAAQLRDAGVAALIARYDALAAEIARLCDLQYAALEADLAAADGVLEDASEITALVSDATMQLGDVDVAAHAQALAERLQRASSSLDSAGAAAPSGLREIALDADLAPVLNAIARLGRVRY